MSTAAYQISHLYFDQFTGDIPQPSPASGQYLVYWWKSIPLGHNYFEAGQAKTFKEVLPDVVRSIAPAIRFHTGKAESDWAGLLLQGNFSAFSNWLSNALAALEPKNLPEYVPVSVVICTRNRPEQLKVCLQSLLSQATKPTQIIVVDNASSDERTAKVAATFPTVTYLHEPHPGLDFARNTGALAATQPVVAYTDDDVHLHPLWTYRMWEAFEQNPKMAALTGLVIATQIDTEAQVIFEKYWSFNRGYAGKVYDAAFFNSNLKYGPPVWEIGAGANMGFRRSVFEQAGYFDELLDAGRAGCNGDSEIWFRILNQGHEIHYNPIVVAFHEHRRTMPELKRQIYQYMRGFTVAAMLQHDRQPLADYRRRLYISLPMYQARRVIKGFPKYRREYQTLFPEIKGMIAGLFYYRKHKNKSAIIPYNAKQNA